MKWASTGVLSALFVAAAGGDAAAPPQASVPSSTSVSASRPDVRPPPIRTAKPGAFGVAVRPGVPRTPPSPQTCPPPVRTGAAVSESCAPALIDALVAEPRRHLATLLKNAASPSTSPALLEAAIQAHRRGHLRFDAQTVTELRRRLPATLATCGQSCDGWKESILEPLARGELYDCPDVNVLGGRQLVDSLPFGDRQCTETISARLAAIADEQLVKDVLAVARHHPTSWGRRNGLRALGRFAGRFGVRPSGRHVVTTMRHDVVAAARHAIERSQDAPEVHDAIWLLDSFFHPDFSIESDLRRISLAPKSESRLRFRALGSWARLLWSKSTSVNADEALFLIRALAHPDRWVRAQASFTVERIEPNRMHGSIRKKLVGAVTSMFDREQTLVAKAYGARALDRHLGGNRAQEVKLAFERRALPHEGSRGAFTVRTGLSAAEVPYWLKRAGQVQHAFFDVLGKAASRPVRDDNNSHWRIFIFADRAQYQAYLEAFIGFGATAGGLYLESAATLYTYQRTADQSRYTLEELLQHELTHALSARFIFPGTWDDIGYHVKPKGWLDEGLAEVMAGLPKGKRTAPTLRSTPLAIVCEQGPGDLAALLTRRAGYDRPGEFAYARAWSFVYYLVDEAPDTLHRVLESFRRDEFSAEGLAKLARAPSLRAVEDGWHAAIKRWCVTDSTESASVVVEERQSPLGRHHSVPL